ncbi:MAG: right-handed parallel beta-helix repeat-containing protein [Lentisphaeria bacterium]|nr:right-handed parallel beta-helix repeat-containing protein [Lentisphaeria bacterium]
MHGVHAFGLLIAVSAAAAAPAVRLDVRAHGAVGDGRNKDTAAIQRAIDACGTAGGGEVVFPPGRYLSGSLRLRAGVHLVLDPGATLLGSADVADFREGPLLLAQDVEDVGIRGGGTIDGQGTAYWEPARTYQGPPWRGTAQFEYRALKRPSFLRFQGCRGVVVRDVTLANSPSWTLHLLRCGNARVEHVTIRNPLHGPNTDGIDINSCTDVVVRHCDIITGDDGIVLKSTEPGHDHPSRDISVEDCRVWSACNAFKIGTETHDHFSAIRVTRCHFYCGSERPLERPLSGIAIESVDGAHLSDIVVSDITMAGVRAPLFVRLGHRGGNSERTRQVEPRVPGRIRGVVIRNVRAEQAFFESSLCGIPGHAVEDIRLEHIDIEYTGGGGPELATVSVPDAEVIAKYPEAQMFGRLPAYGLYCRHVRGLALTDVRTRCLQPDARPMLVCEDVRGLDLDGVFPDAAPAELPVFWFRDVHEARLRACVAPPGTSLFLALEATPAGQVALEECDLSQARQSVAHFPSGGLVRARLPLYAEESPGVVVIDPTGMLLAAPMTVFEGVASPSGKAIGVPAAGGRDVGTARCRFAVSRAGDYTLYVRVHAASPEADSFYATVDEGAPALSDVAERGRWFWDRARNREDDKTDLTRSVTWPLEAGEHTLTIRNRECGTLIDRIALVHEDSPFDPETSPGTGGRPFR